jgi:hypothetical protein
VKEANTMEVHSSEFFNTPHHYMIVSYAGTHFSIRIDPETLVGTDFHSRYNDLLTKPNERDEETGLLKNPLQLLDTTKALQQLVWKTCKSVSEAYAPNPEDEPSTPPERTLQDYIQPRTLHLALVKDSQGENGVSAKIVGDSSSNDYPWSTSHIAQTTTQLTNTYSFDVSPIPAQDLLLLLGPTPVPTYEASELFITRKPTTTESGPMQMQKVHTLTESHSFFKPRLDLMVPEFDREVAVLGAIKRSGLDRKLRVSPFKGLVLLDSGLVAGMLFDWLEGSPLAEHPSLSDTSFHKRWQEQVEAIVKELHRCGIVWGDVNVHNIFIDGNADAWVIDFGGNCNVEFVDEELKETYEGDLQGLRRVFEEWLPSMGKP